MYEICTYVLYGMQTICNVCMCVCVRACVCVYRVCVTRFQI